MKRASIILAMVIGLLISCAHWDRAKIEQKMGPPAKKEVIGDKTIYYYYYSGRSWKIPYNMENWCTDFTFDKDGKLISKREYLVQPSAGGTER